MPTPILASKLYIPAPRPRAILRSRLIERLNAGLQGKLILLSAPAGFGKTTLVGEWIAACRQRGPRFRAAWLSLDKEENDPARFLIYLVAALQTAAAGVGAGALAALQSPQLPSFEALLATLLNEVVTLPDDLVLVLDDYHVIESEVTDRALAFLIEHLPPRVHVVIASREDPPVPLARYRARGQLTELRAADLRFTPAEATDFLNQAMDLALSPEDVAALETRTEGWIAGLQLAAVSMRGRQDVAGFIKSFTGSHHFVLDYLLEEVLQQQPPSVQSFLLHTSLLERLCGPLCEAVLLASPGLGQETLEQLERANLFIVPLDDERRWYRYHHLFADLLRQRLQQQEPDQVAQLHVRASAWYEENGQELEAFQHAAAAGGVERAARLVEGKGMPLQFRGALTPILHWLASLPTAVLDARPSLWVMYASTLSMAGQMAGVEPKLQAAEAALRGAELDDKTRNLIGHIAAIRALLAALQNQAETIIAQSRRALEYLHPDNLAVRTATIWKLGIAYHLQGDRAAAGRAYAEAMAISQASGNLIINMSAATGLGQVQELENQLYQAEQTYRRVLQLAGDPQPPATFEARLGLARICYEWNDLDSAEQHGQQSARLAPLIENTDRSVACELFFARLKLARGDAAGAAAILARAEQSVRQYNFEQRMPELVAAQVFTLLHRGNLVAAAHLAQAHALPLSRARVHLARGDPSAALAVLVPFREQMEAKGWADERLRAMVLQAMAHHARGEKEQAVQLLGDALALAEPGGFVRIFLDEGVPLARLLSETAARGIKPDYTGKLLAAFPAEEGKGKGESSYLLVEPLSQRELEVLQLLARGLSNREIGERLFLALDTVKGHNRRIFDKLQVRRRTEAIARARELGLL